MELLNFGYFGIFLISFIINMLPFVGPSNIVLAGALALSLPWANPFLLGILVALAASSAKLVYFYTAYFIGKNLSPEKREKLGHYSSRTGKVGGILLFLAAVSPIPDETIVIPLAFLKYSVIKFFTIFMSGKMIITIIGAYLGSSISLNLSNLIGNYSMIIISLISTILITYFMMKFDLRKPLARLIKVVKR